MPELDEETKLMISDDLLSEHFDENSDMKMFGDSGDVDFTTNMRTEEEFPDPILERFVSNTAPEKFRADQQVRSFIQLYPFTHLMIYSLIFFCIH